MIASLRRFARRLRRRNPVYSTLTHQEATRLLVEYHFGRLSAGQSAAVEAHVRSCAICRREGLDHAPTERAVALRRLEAVRGARAAWRLRPGILAAALLLVMAAILVLGTLRMVPALLNSSRQSAPQPKPLVYQTALALSTMNASGVASDPGGQTLAVTVSSAAATITLWQAKSGLQIGQLSWPGSRAPSTLAWSPNGDYLAATDGAVLAVWSVSTAQQATRQPPLRLWADPVPLGASAAVYAASTGRVIARPDLASELARQAFLAWGKDGTLVAATPGAQAPINAAAEGGPLVGMWRMGGTHLFALPGGGVGVGSQAMEIGDLDWSHDERYLLWSRVVQPVALAGSTAGSGLTGAPPPNVPLANVAARLAARGRGDALAWFASDGSAIALCDPSASGAALQIVALASSRMVYALPGACRGLSVTQATWLVGTSTLVLALPGQPVQEYPVVLPSS